MITILVSVLALSTSAPRVSDEVQDQILNTANLPAIGLHLVKANTGHAAWVIRGNNLTIDLTGRVLQSGNVEGRTQADEIGTGILLDGCSNVTLKNVSVTGFQCNIQAKNCTNVKILGVQANRSRAMTIASEGKPIEQFLNLRSIAAWRSYGAGIWLEHCTKAEVLGCTTQFAQNGIALVNCQSCLVNDNNCSYNSGWGLALWHSTDNAVVWNHADFCNRPWSGGWGGDAAGLVAVNSCTKNVFVGNSLTHGGDGFFLTDLVNGGFNPDTKRYEFQGSSNRNLVAYNDGSWSSHNAFEGTFAEGNIYLRNYADDSDYGFWLGFASHSMVVQNEIKRIEHDAIAINQGEVNTIFRNDIEDVRGNGVHVWSSPGPVEEDKPSDQNEVTANRLVHCKWGVQFERSTNYQVLSNTVIDAPIPKEIKTGFSDFAHSQLVENWLYHKDVKVAEIWNNRRPKGWQYYRETKGAKGQTAVKLGAFSPIL